MIHMTNAEIRGVLANGRIAIPDGTALGEKLYFCGSEPERQLGFSPPSRRAYNNVL
jgi:hypothetical protein